MSLTHSSRNATAGSMRAARQAGTAPATRAIASISAATPASTSGRPGPVSRKLRNSRMPAIAVTAPTTMPVAVSSRLRRTTSPTTSPGEAPRAMRTPTSRRRSVTSCDSTPYSPMAAISSANPANTPSSAARKPGFENACSFRNCRRLVTSESGSVGSTWPTARRSAATQLVDGRIARAQPSPARAHHPHHPAPAVRLALRERHVDVRLHFPVHFIERVGLLDIADQADHGPPGRVAAELAEPDVLAQRVPTRKIAAREFPVHEGHRLALPCIQGSELASGVERQARHAEIFGKDEGTFDEASLTRRAAPGGLRMYLLARSHRRFERRHAGQRLR